MKMKLIKKSRISGTILGASVGATIGAGTGIVGGPFGAIAVATVFTVIGAGWGFSAGPDVAQKLEEWRNKRSSEKGADGP